MIINRDQALKADDLRRDKVEIPEWGGDLYVREITGAESLVFDSWMAENKDNKKVLGVGWHPIMVMLCACDDKGKRIFQDDDLELLKGKNKVVISRIAEKAIKINKMGADEIEEETKNSSGKASSVSAIGSR